jgi:hypothetical protein
MERILSSHVVSENPYWKGGMRIGRLSSWVNVEMSCRALSHIHWLIAWLNNHWQGKLPRLEARYLDGKLVFYLQSGPHRYVISSEVLPDISWEHIHAFVACRWKSFFDSLPSVQALFVPGGIQKKSRVYPVKGSYALDRGVMLRGKTDSLSVGVLTAKGLVVLGVENPNAFFGKNTLFLDMEHPEEILRKMYDFPLSFDGSRTRLTLY